MKNLFTVTTLLLTLLSYGQQELATAMKNDDVVLLNQNITDSNKNDCIEINGTDYTLLAIAIKLDSKKIFEELITSHKVDLDNICEDKTPLMYAVKYGKEEMVIKLLEAGVNTDKTSKKGKTVLYYAEKYDQKSIAKILKGFKR
ncbi:ankyrin repeat domain-containing protein [Nonlabens sp.]|uniref:ankyrin repeat domain-containing protein n=1 Tax=Nonlabens sp. TaxID=1888209 RepID=UPI003F6981B4